MLPHNVIFCYEINQFYKGILNKIFVAFDVILTTYGILKCFFTQVGKCPHNFVLVFYILLTVFILICYFLTYSLNLQLY